MVQTSGVMRPWSASERGPRSTRAKRAVSRYREPARRPDLRHDSRSRSDQRVRRTG
jgi:hypothetical protein